MTADEMINFDYNLDTHVELNNQEIYDLVTEKVEEEKEEEKESPPLVTFSEATRKIKNAEENALKHICIYLVIKISV